MDGIPSIDGARRPSEWENSSIVDIIESITSIKAIDLLVFFAFFALFILGHMPGHHPAPAGDRLVLLSLLIRAQLWGPLGGFLTQNWTQYSSQYDHMLAFGAVFLAGTIASTIALQLFVKPTPLFAKYPVVDEILGGLLGLFQGAIILAAFFLITDPFFAATGSAAQAMVFRSSARSRRPAGLGHGRHRPQPARAGGAVLLRGPLPD